MATRMKLNFGLPGIGLAKSMEYATLRVADPSTQVKIGTEMTQGAKD